MSVALDPNRSNVQTVPTLEEPSHHLSLASDFFPKLKGKAVWAWTATIENLQAFGQKIRMLIDKVVAAIRNFFGSKFELSNKSVQETLGIGRAQNSPVEEPFQETVPKQNLAEHKPEFFVPVLILPEAPTVERRDLEIQMPGNPDTANGEERKMIVPSHSQESPQTEQVGIFTLFINYFGWLR